MRKVLIIFLLLVCFKVSARQSEIRGRVVDSTGQALPGVSIAAPNGRQLASTDDKGQYVISGTATYRSLVFSFVGYTTREVLVKDASLVTLYTAWQANESVVVIGYGKARKSDVTGAVSSVKAADLLAQPVTNALEGLQGRVAGVDISLNSGAPGGLASVVIRGIGSINSSTNPLYIVDGVALENIQFLNPYDIQNVEVLKDASAAAIYGARGSNGVILITTKRGGDKRGTTVSYDASVSIGKLAREISVLNSTQWLDVLRKGMANNPKWGAAPRTLDLSDRRLFNADGSPIYNTNWQEASTRTAISNNHQLSIQTKGENSATGVFFNYSYNQGIMLNSDLRRFNVRLTHDATINKWLDFGINAMINYTKENEVQPTTGSNTPTRTMIEMPSIFPVKFPDGSWVNNQVSPTFAFLDAAENPAKVLESQTRLNTRTQLFGNTFFNFHITKDLDFKTQLGVDFQDVLYDYYSPSTLLNLSADEKGVASITSEQYRYWQQENYLTYHKKFRGGHQLNVVAGASWQERIDRNVQGSSQYFADDYYRQYNLGAGAQPQSPVSSYDKWAINSYFARVGYNWNDKYLLTLTERIDGSSRFGAANKYGSFPSVGAGWIVSKESFMQAVPVINFLKLRASYGVTGNTEIGSYQSLSTIGSSTTLINGARVGTANVQRFPNPDLKWEKTAQTDIGFEMQLLHNRISIEADYYYKKTTDLLLNKPLPQSTGFSGVLSNIGSVSNKGVDIAITSHNIETQRFSWTSTLTANYNKNTVLKLGANNEDIFPGPYWGPVTDGFTILRVGQSMGSLWGYERMGTWSTDDVAKQLAQNPSFPYKPGEERESTNKRILGKNTPDWTGSFSNTFRYGNWSLLVDLQYATGAKIVQAFLFSSEDRTGYSNSLTTVLDAWTPQHQNTAIQELRFAPDAGQSARFDSHWVADGSFLRGRNIVLSYALSNNVLSALKIKRARFYVSAQNLFVLTSSSYKGYDPQSVSWNSAGGPPFGQNIEFYQYPKPRTFTLGLNVGF